jgi:hypothetical protein
MHYYTRLQESPTLVTLAMLKVNPTTRVEVVALEDRYGRTVTVRTVLHQHASDVDSVYVCAGDNPVFVANVIALAHAHNLAIDAAATRDWCDGI